MTLNVLYLGSRTDPTYIDRTFQAIAKRAEDAAWRYHHPDPQEFSQQVCERIWERWQHIDQNRSFAGYVNRTVRRLLTDEARKRKTRHNTVSDEEVEIQQTAESIYTPSRDAYRDVTIINHAKVRQLAEMLLSGSTKAECAVALKMSVRAIERMVA